MKTKLEYESKSFILQYITDSLVMIGRSSRHIIRNTDQLLGTFFQPIMFLVLFSAVFGGAIELSLPEGVDYLSFLMAGIIVQTVAFGSTTTAIAVANDMQKGIIDRFRSLPMSNLAVLNGHVVSDVFRNTLSTVVMLITGLALGFRSNANLVDWLVIALILVLFTFAFSWLAASIGLLAKSVEGVQWMTFVIIFPLTFASSAFVPTEAMTPVLKAFAENQPITQVIEAVRALMLGFPPGDYIMNSILWCVGAMIFAIPLTAWLFKRKTNL